MSLQGSHGLFAQQTFTARFLLGIELARHEQEGRPVTLTLASRDWEQVDLPAHGDLIDGSQRSEVRVRRAGGGRRAC